MRVTGKKIWHMDKAVSSTVMEMCTKATGCKIKLRVQASIRIWMELSTKGSGRKINSVDRAGKVGLMGPCMKETTKMARNTVLESSNGQTGQNTKAILRTITLKVSVLTLGLTTENMKESGKKTKCMEREGLCGQMEESMRASI